MEFSSNDERLKKLLATMLSDIDKVIYDSQMELSGKVSRESWRMFQFGAVEQVIRSMNIEQEAVDWFLDHLFSDENPEPIRKSNEQELKVVVH